jgi:hypothetical protein
VKADPIIFITCLLGLLSLLPMSCVAETQNASSQSSDALHMAAAPVDNEDDEEDEEEEAVDYRDRVREIQRWMNRRDTERKGGAPTLNAVPPPPQFPKYFRDNGLDVNGYRKLEPDIRVRLRDAPEAAPDAAASIDDNQPRYKNRHHSWRTRGQRHGHSYIRAQSRHGYHYSYSRHINSEGVSSHHYGHRANNPASDSARSKHYIPSSRPKPASHFIAASKSTKKNRSRR